MNLKESFRYHNYLTTMLSSMETYFMNRNNVTRTMQEHMRKKSNPDAQDEKIDATPERLFPDYDVDRLVAFYQALAEEKFKLSAAVEAAKRGYKPICFDAAMETNKIRQNVASALRRMAATKNTETVTNGRDYKFNVNGDQVPYVYDIKSVTTIDFDRNLTKRLAKKYTDEANAVSDQLDHAMLDIEVVIEPAFNMTENLEESVDSFMNTHAA